MTVKKVALVDLGEGLTLSLSRLATRLNSLQTAFEFKEAEGITHYVLGDPDVEDLWYSSKTFFESMRQTLRHDHFDFVVGVTRLPLAHLDAMGRTVDKNYFSISDATKLTVASVHLNVLTFKTEWKTEYQYLAYLITCELLINLCGQDLMHLRADSCIFDDCVERAHLVDCLNKAHICEDCSAKLKKLNVSNQTINAVEAVLKWCRKETMSTIIKYALKHPLTGFSLGIGLGWLVSAKVTPDRYKVILVASLAVPLLLVLWKRFFRNSFAL